MLHVEILAKFLNCKHYNTKIATCGHSLRIVHFLKLQRFKNGSKNCLTVNVRIYRMLILRPCPIKLPAANNIERSAHQSEPIRIELLSSMPSCTGPSMYRQGCTKVSQVSRTNRKLVSYGQCRKQFRKNASKPGEI